MQTSLSLIACSVSLSLSTHTQWHVSNFMFMLINWNNLLIIRTLLFIFQRTLFFLNLDPGENYQFPTHLCYGLFVSQLGTQRLTKD